MSFSAPCGHTEHNSDCYCHLTQEFAGGNMEIGLEPQQSRAETFSFEVPKDYAIVTQASPVGGNQYSPKLDSVEPITPGKQQEWHRPRGCSKSNPIRGDDSNFCWD